MKEEKIKTAKSIKDFSVGATIEIVGLELERFRSIKEYDLFSAKWKGERGTVTKIDEKSCEVTALMSLNKEEIVFSLSEIRLI